MKKIQECETRQAYNLEGGLRGIVLDSLKTFPQIKVVAIKHHPTAWRIHYIREDNLIYIEEQK
jgi:hypothetical protein